MTRDVRGRFAPTGSPLTHAESMRRFRERRRAIRHHEQVRLAAAELRRFWKAGSDRPLLVQRYWLAA